MSVSMLDVVCCPNACTCFQQEDEEEVAPRAKLAPRRAAAANKKTYIDVSEDEDCEAISLQDSDGSEFEA